MFDASQAAPSFDDCRLLYRQLGRESFRAKLPAAALIQCRVASDKPAHHFETVVARRGSPEDVEFTRLGDVRPLRKRSATAPFQTRIGIGRTASVDVRLSHEAVSKYHAYFEFVESSGWVLADAGSKNGTSLNGERLARSRPTVVRDGARVRFGHLEFLFCTQDGFLQLVGNRGR